MDTQSKIAVREVVNLIHRDQPELPAESLRELISAIFRTIPNAGQLSEEIDDTVDRMITLYRGNSRVALYRAITERDSLNLSYEHNRKYIERLRQDFSNNIELQSKLPTTSEVMTRLEEILSSCRKEEPNIAGILLWGSWARGQQRPDSDIDYTHLTNFDQKPSKKICLVVRKYLEGFTVDGNDGWMTIDGAREEMSSCPQFYRGHRFILST